MSLIRRFSLVVLACFLATVTGAQAPTPDGPAFVINEANGIRNENAHISATSGSAFVVAWDGWDDSTAYDAETVRVRPFSAPGVPVVGEFIAGYGDGYLDYYYGNRTLETDDIAARPSGEFVVVWNEGFSGYFDVAIRARAFDASATPLGEEFTVSDNDSYYDAKGAAMAVDDSGQFAVVWETRYTDQSGQGLYRRHFTEDQTFLTEELRLNQTTFRDQSLADVITLPGGGIFTAWTDSSGSGRHLIGRYFSSPTATGTDEITITGDTGLRDFLPALALRADGHVLIVWLTLDIDPFVWRIYGRFIEPSTGTLSSVFPITDMIPHMVERPKVAALPGNRGFAVVWEEEISSSDHRAFVQHLFPSGVLAGGKTAVDATPGLQKRPAVAGLDEGRFVVTWDDSDYMSTATVFGRAFTAAVDPSFIFTDGFESGDTTAWTSATP